MPACAVRVQKPRAIVHMRPSMIHEVPEIITNSIACSLDCLILFRCNGDSHTARPIPVTNADFLTTDYFGTRAGSRLARYR